MFHWHQKHIEEQSLGDRVADRVASFIGSWKFVCIQTSIFIIWIIGNTLWLFHGLIWDPYPFILFNLVMSAEAAYSTPLIMMSQNRQAERDRVHAEHDYQVNIEAKNEIEQLMEQLNRIELEKLDILITQVNRLIKLTGCEQ